MPREGFEPSIPRSSVSPYLKIRDILVRSYPYLGKPRILRATPPWHVNDFLFIYNSISFQINKITNKIKYLL